MIFLIYNMGNSGGSWFENVCNSNPRVRVWEEVLRQTGQLKVLPKEPEKRNILSDRLALEFIKKRHEENKYDSVGLIKSFGSETEKYCYKNSGRFIQMYRSPLKVVKYKMYHKKEACLHRNKFDLSNKENEFEAHVEFYQSLYNKFIRRGERIKTVRLEDLSASLMTDGKYIKNILEYITQIEWPFESISFVKSNVFPRGKQNFKDDDDKRAWLSWNDREKEVFNKYFKDIMFDLNYRIPE